MAGDEFNYSLDSRVVVSFRTDGVSHRALCISIPGNEATHEVGFGNLAHVWRCGLVADGFGPIGHLGL